MNVIVTCPNCGKELETDDEVGRLQCPCGTTLEVPSGGDESSGGDDESPCPNCSAAVPAGGVICVSCGYNLKTGQTLGTATGDDAEESGSVLDRSEDDEYEDDDQLDVLSKFKPLFKLGALVVLILVGVGIYMAANAKNFGIAGKTPLGTEAEVETYLKKIGMVLKGEKKADENGNTTFTYWDKKLFIQSKEVSNQWVRVHAGSDGKVIAIMGQFDSTDMGPAGGRTCGFIRTLWKDVGGDVQEKTITTDTLHAKWTRGTINLGLNEFYDETIGVALPGSPYVPVIDSFCTHVEDNREIIMSR